MSVNSASSATLGNSLINKFQEVATSFSKAGGHKYLVIDARTQEVSVGNKIVNFKQITEFVNDVLKNNPSKLNDTEKKSL